MKNHIIVNGKLLQTNKKFSQLKNSQKQKINGWLYEEYEKLRNENGREPGRPQKEIIINDVYSKIEEAEIWLLCPPSKNRHKIALKNGMNLNNSFIFVKTYAFIPRFT